MHNPNSVGTCRTTVTRNSDGSCTVRWYRFDGAILGAITRNGRTEALASYKNFFRF